MASKDSSHIAVMINPALSQVEQEALVRRIRDHMALVEGCSVRDFFGQIMISTERSDLRTWVASVNEHPHMVALQALDGHPQKFGCVIRLDDIKVSSNGLATIRFADEDELEFYRGLFLTQTNMTVTCNVTVIEDGAIYQAHLGNIDKAEMYRLNLDALTLTIILSWRGLKKLKNLSRIVDL